MANGVFIPNFRKPKRCSKYCIFADNMNYDCILIGDSVWFDTFEEQYRHCPLIEMGTEDEEEEMKA